MVRRHQRESEEESRDDAGGEHSADGDIELCADDDDRNARRDHRTDDRTRRRL